VSACVVDTLRLCLLEGDPAPDFTLTSDSGDRVRSPTSGASRRSLLLSQGRHAGLHEAGFGIRDAYGEFERAGAVVFGVSPDDEGSHAKFKNKYELPFSLLADNHSVASSTRLDESRLGKSTGVSAARLRDRPDGNVKSVMHNVKPASIADDVPPRSRSDANHP